jgi:hypothetical protein
VFIARKDFLFERMRMLNISPGPPTIAKGLKYDFRDLDPLVEEIAKT